MTLTEDRNLIHDIDLNFTTLTEMLFMTLTEVFVCVCVCGWGFLCTLIWYLGFMGILFMLSWMFQHEYLDTCCFECLMCMCYVFFVFAPVQRS